MSVIELPAESTADTAPLARHFERFIGGQAYIRRDGEEFVAVVERLRTNANKCKWWLNFEWVAKYHLDGKWRQTSLFTHGLGGNDGDWHIFSDDFAGMVLVSCSDPSYRVELIKPRDPRSLPAEQMIEFDTIE